MFKNKIKLLLFALLVMNIFLYNDKVESYAADLELVTISWQTDVIKTCEQVKYEQQEGILSAPCANEAHDFSAYIVSDSDSYYYGAKYSASTQHNCDEISIATKCCKICGTAGDHIRVQFAENHNLVKYEAQEADCTKSLPNILNRIYYYKGWNDKLDGWGYVATTIDERMRTYYNYGADDYSDDLFFSKNDAFYECTYCGNLFNDNMQKVSLSSNESDIYKTLYSLYKYDSNEKIHHTCKYSHDNNNVCIKCNKIDETDRESYEEMNEKDFICELQKLTKDDENYDEVMAIFEREKDYAPNGSYNKNYYFKITCKYCNQSFNDIRDLSCNVYNYYVHKKGWVKAIGGAIQLYCENHAHDKIGYKNYYKINKKNKTVTLMKTVGLSSCYKVLYIPKYCHVDINEKSIKELSIYSGYKKNGTPKNKKNLYEVKIDKNYKINKIVEYAFIDTKEVPKNIFSKAKSLRNIAIRPEALDDNKVFEKVFKDNDGDVQFIVNSKNTKWYKKNKYKYKYYSVDEGVSINNIRYIVASPKDINARYFLCMV